MRWRAWRRCRSRGICRRVRMCGSEIGRPRRRVRKRQSSWRDRRHRQSSSTASTGATSQAEWLVEAYLQQGRFAKADSLIAEIRRALDAGVGADDAAARDAMFDALVRMRVRYVLARADWTRGLEADAARRAATLRLLHPPRRRRRYCRHVARVGLAIVISPPAFPRPRRRARSCRRFRRRGWRGLARRPIASRRPRASTSASAASKAAPPPSSSSCA